MSSTERRLETTSQNVANVSTPGYKRQVSYSDVAAALSTSNKTDSASNQYNMQQADFAQGKLRQTGNPLDIAISSNGFFQVRASESFFYTRQGQFKLTPDGALVTAQGFILQGDGGDLVLNGTTAEILDDGTVLENGLPTSRIPVFMAEDQSQLQSVSGSLFAARDGDLEPMDKPMLRQGFVESSNVTMASEMVAMMAAIRQAETGSRLIQVYDDLVGKALSTFGR